MTQSIFPAIGLNSYASSLPLKAFIDAVPDGSRVMLETHTRDPNVTIMPDDFLRALWVWQTRFWPERRVELIGNEFNFYWNNDFGRKYLMNFNADDLPVGEMMAVMDAIGADYLVVNSSITLHMLKEQGFELVQSLDMTLVPDEERRLLNLPIGHLILMRKPENDEGVIAPRTKWTRWGNTLTFEARRGLVYRVKYRHDKGFVAEQSGKRLPIEIYPGCDELNLPFMRIRAPEDGPIRLAFRDRLF